MSGRELLVEIGCEEIPANWVEGLESGFAKAVSDGLEKERLAADGIVSHSTLRRLVVHGTGVPESQSDEVRDVLGPPWRLAKDPEGGWSPAAAGFARRQGIGAGELDSQLRQIATPRGEYLGVRQVAPGRKTLEILPGILESALRSLDLPKAMNWDASIEGKAFPFARPIRWIVALFGGQVVPFHIEVAGGEPVVAGNRSRGHRFRSLQEEPGSAFEVSSFTSLSEGLRKRFVILEAEARENKLWEALNQAGTSHKLTLEDFPAQHHNLVEWPGVVCGRYPEQFGELPVEIRRAVLIYHQKYLPATNVCAFLAVTNAPDDPQDLIRRGVERVVRARLRDAKFFWDEALARPLQDRQEDLARVTFHRRIGHLLAHSERVARLARWIAVRVDVNPDVTERAACLAKCDLTTNLVAEFPFLQGEAGGRILEAQGAPDTVWKAVYDQYRPVGLDPKQPASAEGAVVTLADRAATLAGLFAAGEGASGSGDPFGLRRMALGMLAVLRDAPGLYQKGGWPTPAELLREALSEPVYEVDQPENLSSVQGRLVAFVRDRLPYVLTPLGSGRSAVRAVLAVHGVEHPVFDSWRRIVALDKAVTAGRYTTLAVAHKRARRILPPGSRQIEFSSHLLTEHAEKELFDRLYSVRQKFSKLAAVGDYHAAFALIAELAPTVDAFFDDVLVMAEDPAVRANRLALLARLDALFSEVGDLSQIEASAS